MEEKITYIKDNWLNKMPEKLMTVQKTHPALANVMYQSYRYTSRDVFEDMLPLLKEDVVEFIHNIIKN